MLSLHPHIHLSALFQILVCNLLENVENCHYILRRSSKKVRFSGGKSNSKVPRLDQ